MKIKNPTHKGIAITPTIKPRIQAIHVNKQHEITKRPTTMNAVPTQASTLQSGPRKEDSNALEQSHLFKLVQGNSPTVLPHA